MHCHESVRCLGGEFFLHYSQPLVFFVVEYFVVQSNY